MVPKSIAGAPALLAAPILLSPGHSPSRRCPVTRPRRSPRSPATRGDDHRHDAQHIAAVLLIGGTSWAPSRSPPRPAAGNRRRRARRVRRARRPVREQR